MDRRSVGGNVLPAKRGPSDDIDDLIDDEWGQEAADEYMAPPDEFEMDMGAAQAGRNWKRPDAPPLSPSRQSLVFQQLDVDYFIGAPYPDIYPPEVKEAPIVRMYGVTAEGHSVCAFVHGFEPYFYCDCPPQWQEDDLDTFANTLRARMADKGRGGTNPIRAVGAVEAASLLGYQGGLKRRFLRITTHLPNQVTPCRSLLESGITFGAAGHHVLATYESNVLFVLRFMIDTHLVGASWLELPAGAYSLAQPGRPPATLCQYEVHVRFDKFIAHMPEGEYAKIAPFRVLSFDIECAGRKGCFPEPQKDPVIQIASMLTVQGESAPLVRNVLTLDSCAPIVGAQVESFAVEADLLRRWGQLVLDTDPDIIIGYNICNFDLPYLFERGEALGIAREFHHWGRVRGSRVRMKDSTFSSKAYGTHEYKDLTIEGRVQLDLYLALQRDHKLSSYSLNAVSAHFLGEQKEDVHHSAIADLQAGNDETRRRLAVYCLKDAYLPQRLLDKLMYLYNYVEMARVTGVPMSFLLTRGQSIKVFSQLLRKSRTLAMVVPNIKGGGNGASGADGVGYEGATVLEPKIGFYEKPVATLDFASLYPSIMMSHNLCYSTLVPPDKVHLLPPEDVEKSPSGDVFVRSHRQRGILPEILEELLAARKRAKADLKAADDPFVKAVLDGRQLALKVSANSVYGFTGATVGKMPCLAISASTTAYGRLMIEQARSLVMSRFNRANGYETDCDVIYGDTDSVMVNFKVSDVRRAMELGREAAEYITTTFPPPVKLEFEKVYYPYLLMNKKRYAGLLWTRPETHDKMDSKGIETVRRDNCLLVRNVVTESLRKILVERDVPAAIEFVKATISELLMNKVDLSLLVVTKALTQDVDKYDTKAAHVELAKKMRQRDAATAPGIGDRVAFVIVQAAKGAKAYEKAEDPIFALEHNLPIDTQHYLEHHLSQPLTRIFEPVMKNPKELLSGAHTRTITMATPSMAVGGIMRFAKVKLSCLACKAPLEGVTSGSLCKHCKKKEAEVYAKQLSGVNALQAQFNALWTQCQRCQGSLHQDVLCTSRDCPIFYRRKKVQKDLGEATSQLQRFQDETW